MIGGAASHLDAALCREPNEAHRARRLELIKRQLHSYAILFFATNQPSLHTVARHTLRLVCISNCDLADHRCDATITRALTKLAEGRTLLARGTIETLDSMLVELY